MLESLMPNHLEPQNMELIRMKAAHLMFFFIATNIPPVLDYKSVCFREHRTDVLSSCFLWEPSPSQEDSASTANKSSPLWSGLSPGSRHWIVVAKPTVSASAQWAQASPPPASSCCPAAHVPSWPLSTWLHLSVIKQCPSTCGWPQSPILQISRK